MMRALVKTQPKPGLELISVPKPEVKTRSFNQRYANGICGTDLHIYNWTNWAQRNIRTPRILGHEFVVTLPR